MRTNIELDPLLIKEASKLTGIIQKKALVEKALQVLIQTTKRRKLSDLEGKIKFSDGYDHKNFRI